MGFERLNVRVEEGIAFLEFNHGKVNEMGSQELRELEALCDLLESAGGPRALVTTSRKVTSRGTPIFVSGANVTERVGWSEAQVLQHVRWQRRVLSRLRHAPVFHVVVVQGVAFGWGTEFLLTADYRIATSAARFALPETGLGIVPGAGGTSDLWADIGVAHALRLGMTGEEIRSEEACRIGLVHEAVDDQEGGLARAAALASRVARRSPTAVAAFKAGVLSAVGRRNREHLEDRAYATCLASGEAQIGRENFKAIRSGEPVPWGPRRAIQMDGGIE